MHRILQCITEVTAMAGIAVIAGGCAHHHGGHHGAHQGSRGDDGNGLSVIGIGEATAAPDIARASIGIEVRDESAEAATGQANERMTAVISALKAAGVAESDLRTHDFSIAFERDFSPPQPVVQLQAAPVTKGGRAAPAAAVQPATPAEPRGVYRVSNTVEVTVRDIAKASQVLTAATKAGANNVWGVYFELSNRTPLHQKAREEAIVHARQDAEQLARLTGVKLGRIVVVDDQPAAAGTPVYARAMRLEKAADGATPIEQGELTVTHQVRLVYALEEP